MQGDKSAGLSKQNKALLQSAARKAIALLDNPHVQEQIARALAEGINTVKDAQKRRSEQRQVKSQTGHPARVDESASRSPRRSVSARFGNKKLERRVQNLSDNIELLEGSVDPEAAEALDEAEAVVARLKVAVAMARNLPIGKRQKAHWEIDSVLDELERAVFHSAMP